jgi:hypothetical protein
MGVSTGLTVFAIVIPITHLLVDSVAVLGVDLGAWNNPVEVFLFLAAAAVFGVFPWGLWIILTDARTGTMFGKDHNIVEYLLASMAVYFTLAFLVCTSLQHVYQQFRWFFTPALLACAAALLYWRWSKVWGFPTKIGARRVLDYAVAIEHES